MILALETDFTIFYLVAASSSLDIFVLVHTCSTKEQKNIAIQSVLSTFRAFCCIFKGAITLLAQF